MNETPEIAMRCDECHEVFMGPPLQFNEEFWYRVEQAGKFCTTECAVRNIEGRGMAKAASMVGG